MHRRLALCLIAIAPASAWAEVTPEALWTHWKTGEGALTATGETSGQGGTLTTTGAALSMGDVTAEIGEMTLTAEGEATRVTLPETWTVTSGEITATITAPGATLLASGEASDPAYTIDAPTLTAPIEGAGQPLAVTAEDLSGDLASDGVDLTVAMLSLVSEAAGDLSAFSVTRNGIALELDGPLEALADLAEGEAPPDMTLALTSESSEQVVTPPEDGAPTFTIASGATRDTVTVASGQATIEQGLSDVALTVTGPGVPLPDASARADTFALSLTTPAATSEEPAPVAFEANLSDLTVSEQVWQLFDPAAALPRDPANLNFALSGQVVRRTPSEMTPERLGLDDFRLSLLGAEITGKGSVLFQDAAGETPYGRPVGSFSFDLKGVTALLDQLEALGTIPAGQLMGARLGLGFFTTEVEGQPGTLRSAVDIGPQGGVTLNGQRVFQLP